MSDPQPVPQRRTPRRAEPLQPDKPGQGDERQRNETGNDPAARALEVASTDKAREQSHEALKNVSAGYD